jgi:hypothetical protein
MNRIAHLFAAEQRRGVRYALRATLERGPRKGQTHIVQGTEGPRTFATMSEALDCAERLFICNAGTASYKVVRHEP